VQLKASPMQYNRPLGMQHRYVKVQISVMNTQFKDKLAEKRKLHKLWQINRCPVLKTKLNRAIKAFKNLLETERNQEI